MVRHTHRLGAALLALVVGLGLAGPAPAQQTVPHWEYCTGTILVEVFPDTVYFTGEGIASHYGNYSITGSYDVDGEGNVFNGQFTSTVDGGSTLAGTCSGFYFPLPTYQVVFILYMRWTEGTGTLAGVTGEAAVLWVVEGIAPGAAFDYMARGFLTLP